jgi:hypothetical protein
MDALIMIHGKLIALLVCFQPDAGSGGGMTDSLSAYGAAFVLYIVRPFYYEYTRYTNSVLSTAFLLHKATDSPHLTIARSLSRTKARLHLNQHGLAALL